MSRTIDLATFLSKISYEELPAQVIEMAKRCIIDYMGCALFATKTEMGEIVIRVCQEGNFGKSNILPSFEGKYDSSRAAFANGTLAHGFELDDVNLPSVSHPGAVVISTALALGQEKEINGKRLIEAIVSGYEAMERIGKVLGEAHVDYGHHPTGTHGVFGGAAAASRILGLDGNKTANAFGLAGSMASGVMQFSISGTMVKRMHAGKAAQQGILSAKLAEKGFTGPTDILEGALGYCIVYRGEQLKDALDFDLINKDFGKDYAIMRTAVKPSPACGCLHSVIECMEKICRMKGFDPNDIEEIIVKGHKNLVTLHNDYRPQSILAAQYSLPFTVGLSIVTDITDPGIYLSEEILGNEKILRYADLVKAVLDDEIEQQFPERFGAKVEVKTSSGKLFKEAIYAQKGSAENPFTVDEVLKKYRTLAGNVLDEKQVERIEKKIMAVEECDDVSKIFTDIR